MFALCDIMCGQFERHADRDAVARAAATDRLSGVKKILAGCLIVAVIAMIGFGVAGFYAYRAARPMIESAGDYMERAREMARLGERVANRAPYMPPANGELTPAQVERFLAVQTRVRDELGERWSEIEKQVGGNPGEDRRSSAS